MPKFLFLMLLLFGCGGGGSGGASVTPNQSESDLTLPSTNFALLSRSIGLRQDLPGKHASEFGNHSIDLIWLNAPANTKSFCIILQDIDTSTPFIHWSVFNIPSTVKEIAESASGQNMPQEAIEGVNGMQTTGYYGPNPPAGEDHRYTVRIYAMQVETINITPNTSYSQESFSEAFSSMILDSATLSFRFQGK